MKLVMSVLALGAVAFAPSAEAAVCGHDRTHCARHMAYHHHFHHYAYGYGYTAPAPYGYPPPYGYAPGYFYANPPVYNRGPEYGPYPWSWGDRNTLNLLLNEEGDEPYTD